MVPLKIRKIAVQAINRCRSALACGQQRYPKTAGLLKFAVFIAVILVTLTDARAWIGLWSYVTQPAGLCALLLIIHRYTVKHFKRRFTRAPRPRRFIQVPEARAKKLQEEIGESKLLTLEQAEVFTRMILEPAEFQQRIVEDYRPSQRTLQKRVAISVQIRSQIAHRPAGSREQTDGAPGLAGSSVYYPVVLPPKGVLYDDFRVYDANGGALPTLSYREYLHIAASALHLLLAVACNAPPDKLPEDVAECERQAIWGLISRRDAERDTRDSHGAADAGSVAVPTGDELAESLRALVPTPPTDEPGNNRWQAIETAAQLVEVLCSRYAIVALVSLETTTRFALSYECTLIPELDLAPQLSVKYVPARVRRTLHTMKTRLNVLLATRPVDVKVTLDNAWNCESFHVLVHCPDGLYLANQELIVARGYLSRTAPGAPTRPYIRFRKRLGQPYAHFYCRYFPPPKTARRDQDGKVLVEAERTPRLILQFHEVPPGSVCRAALAAIASAVLVWIIGYGLGHLRSGVLETDAPAILLAFPGIAASWMGFDATTNRLFEGTLTARLSLAWTASISLVATALYLLHQKLGGSAGHAVAPVKITLLGVSSWPWVLLTALALFNASYLTYRWGINSWRFRYLAQRPDVGSAGGSVGEEG